MKLFRSAVVFAANFLSITFAASLAQAAVVISTDPTSNMTCTNGVCTPTAKQANLNVTDLTNLLAQRSVRVRTKGQGLDIHVRAPFSWTGTETLILQADRSISFESPVTVAGPGGVTLFTNLTTEDGGLSFIGSGQLMFWDTNSALAINGNAYKLEGDLATLSADIATNPSGLFALAKSYDASVDGVYSAAPITTGFAGALEGLGNTVGNLTISASPANQSAGLFAQTLTGSMIRDIGIVNANISGANIEGALAGLADGMILNSYATGTVSGAIDYGGGLVGWENQTGLISKCRADVSVSGSGASGGLVGYAVSAKYVVAISQSSASGSVSGAGAGGLVGQTALTEIDQSYASGTVTGTGTAGGLVGSGGAPVTRSFATGDVTVGDGSSPNAYSMAGGLIGYDLSSGISQSFATGNVSGHARVELGGLVGFSQQKIESSYATGNVIASRDESFVGGLVGSSSCSQFISSSYAIGHIKGGTSGGLAGYGNGFSCSTNGYWDTETSGKNRGMGGTCRLPKHDCQVGMTGLTTEQLQSGLPAGFDSAIWAEKKNVNNGLPYLIANKPR